MEIQVSTMKMPGTKNMKIRRMGLRFMVIQFLMRSAPMLERLGRLVQGARPPALLMASSWRGSVEERLAEGWREGSPGLV